MTHTDPDPPQPQPEIQPAGSPEPEIQPAETPDEIPPLESPNQGNPASS